ncbi:MAG: protein kinase [Gemmataceae bacterium]
MAEPHFQTEPTHLPNLPIAAHQTHSFVSPTPGADGGRPNVPETIGRYRIQGMVGQGGMGVVLKAHDPELNRLVAIKLPILGGQGTQATMRRHRFLREARAAAAIAHPNVCSIHDVGELNGQPFVVMTFIEGESLAERLHREPTGLPLAEAVRLIRGVAEGLAVVHAAGIIHRDIKPGNILIDPTGKPVLTDFGLARVLEDTDHATVEGAVMGTPAYMAPEQAAGRTAEIGPPTDVYGLGAVLYHLLTGRPPFSGPTLSVLVKVQQETPTGLRGIRPDLDPRLIAMVERAMARTPNLRYPNACSLAADLTALADAPPLRGRSWRTAHLGAIAAIAGCLAIGIGLVVRSRPATPTPSPTTPQTVATPAVLEPSPTPESPLEAEFSMVVWSSQPNGTKRGIPIQHPTARPLLTDEKVQFRIRFNRPSYAYLAWVTPTAEVLLLHPGNGRSVSPIADALPPVNTPVRELMSPSDAESGWELDETIGAETIVLMARSTPLPPNVELRQLIGRVDGTVRDRAEEFYWLTLEPGATVARYNLPGFGSKLRGPRLTPQRIDTPFLGLMKRLHTHFDHIEVIRFHHAHPGKK